EVEVQLKDRIKIATDRLMVALETVEAICEPVEAPRSDLEFIHYFCGNTENPDDLKANEYKPMALYKSIVEYIRAYAGLKADFSSTSFAQAKIHGLHDRLAY